MTSPAEKWMCNYNEASKLADEINTMVSEASSLPPTGTQTQRHFSGTRRKIWILNTRLDSLQKFLADLPIVQTLSGRETNRRRGMLTNLKDKVKEMETTLNSHSSAYRDRLLGPDRSADDVMKRASDMDNNALLGFQQRVMGEQDEELEKLEEGVLSTKHIALAVNEELNLPGLSRKFRRPGAITDGVDDHLEVTGSRLQRVQRSLGILNRSSKGGCSRLMQLAILIVVLILVALALIKFL